VTVSEPILIQASKDTPEDLLKEDSILKPLKAVKHVKVPAAPKETKDVTSGSTIDSL
jgi:hypothetical protein